MLDGLENVIGTFLVGGFLIFSFIKYQKKYQEKKERDIWVDIFFDRVEEFIRSRENESGMWSSNHNRSCTTSNLRIYVKSLKNHFEFYEKKDCFMVIEYDDYEYNQIEFVLNKNHSFST